ncbi:ATP-dependent zinc protease family protein [Gilvimarinus sp. 1_MG-2023]|uniref:ATP-dependent zinc protease family protein n=1 Tax=Gilvimarinus sp. 1_MG-2023 TaxID=3062638 RepID=UPI0026E1BF87|nr:RimK/LysX family protein [Gilvimarinus sp. 1_MG-2023]MDO6747527.1 RimK/LysX family protein [Gilvimarinus sp. 1_MG-2023]
MTRYLWVAVLLILSGCSQSQYKLVGVDDLAELQSCAVTADNHHHLLLEQQLELKQGVNELISEIERSRAEVTALNPNPEECLNYSAQTQSTVVESVTVDDVAKQLVGANETVHFEELNIALAARIDTGAMISTIQVRDIQTFERNGESWVRFSINEAPAFEKKMLRYSQIQGQRENKRPVIQLRFSLGRVTQLAEFALADTAFPGNPVRVGRMALRDVMVVDVSRDHIASTTDNTP